MAIRAGRVVFGLGNPVSGPAGKVLIPRKSGGGKSSHPSGLWDGRSIAPYTFGTFAISGHLLQANFSFSAQL